MISLLNFDFLKTEKVVREFTSALGLKGEIQYECIYRSDTFGSERQVLKVAVGDRLFALKLDDTGNKTGRLKDEYSLVQRLYPHFQQREQVAIPEPIYLSPSGKFFVLDYVGDRLASKPIRSDENEKSIGQIFRRAGNWLHALHEFTPASETEFWPNWMVEAVDRAANASPQADASAVQIFRDKLETDASRLQGRRCCWAFCHGDFHASNLILAEGNTYGFDFTEAGTKLAIYDIVDFLKIDAFRGSVLDQVDQSGISRHSKEMFFKRYRHPVDQEVLDLCIKGRLLIDWVSITQERFKKSAFQRNKYARLKERLEIAFSF